MGLGRRPQRAEDPFPFPVRQRGRIGPGPAVGIETDVGPQMMAVRGEVDPSGAADRNRLNCCL